MCLTRAGLTRSRADYAAPVACVARHGAAKFRRGVITFGAGAQVI